VYVQLWEVPYDAYVEAATESSAGSGMRRSQLPLDLAFSGVHAVIIAFDASAAGGGDDYWPLRAVDACRDEVETRIGQSLGGAASSFPLYLLAHKAEAVLAPTVPAPALAAASLSAAAAGTSSALAATAAPSGGAAAATRRSGEPGWVEVSVSSSGGPPGGAPTPFMFGLDAQDLDSYSQACGYRAWSWTSVLGGGGAPVVGRSPSLLALRTTLVDDMLEYWGMLTPSDVARGAAASSSSATALPSPPPGVASRVDRASVGFTPDRTGSWGAAPAAMDAPLPPVPVYAPSVADLLFPPVVVERVERVASSGSGGGGGGGSAAGGSPSKPPAHPTATSFDAAPGTLCI